MNESERSTDSLIADLADDLTPVSNPGKTFRLTSIWLLAAWSITGFLLTWRAPYRAGAMEQLTAFPVFAIESAIGFSALLAIGAIAFRAAIPASTSVFVRVVVPLVLFIIWSGFYLYGLFEPALPASMAGKRPHCWAEVLLTGVPSLIVGLYLIGRLYPLHHRWNGALIGAVAGGIPALLMQFACMYAPHHILTHHMLPAVLMTVLAAAVGSIWFAKE